MHEYLCCMYICTACIYDVNVCMYVCTVMCVHMYVWKTNIYTYVCMYVCIISLCMFITQRKTLHLLTQHVTVDYSASRALRHLQVSHNIFTYIHRYIHTDINRAYLM